MHIRLISCKNKIYRFSTIATALIVSLSYPVYGYTKIDGAIAQTPSIHKVSALPQNRKAEADKLLETGTKQLDDDQNEATLQSFQQALAIYREIKDRQGEGKALQGEGNAYLDLDNSAKAIEYC